MKEYSRYTLGQDGYYDTERCDSVQLEVLGDLLRSDVGSGFKDLIEWAESTYFKRFSGNLVLCHKENDFIKIYFDQELMGSHSPLFVSKKTFVGIMQDWGRLYKEKPKEIIITRDGDTITLEGKN